jgi:exodeoxyribonuclease V
MLHWSPQQDGAIMQVRAWLADPSGPQIFRLFGYAGTGKTTLAKELANAVKGTVLYATFTGKAALVLRKKGCDDASTIHSLIYKVEVDPDTGEASFNLNPESALASAKLLIVDEVSMVPEILATDLMSYGKRILVLGDPAQLPPIDGEGFFINAQPDIMLTEVHRQAAENPIIRMSMDIREGKRLQLGTYGESRVIRKAMQSDVMGSDQLICGLNKSRVTFNRKIRALKGLLDEGKPYQPSVGDRLICLKNKHDEGLFNGGLWEAQEVELESYKERPFYQIRVASLDEDRDPQTVKVLPDYFSGNDREIPWKVRRNYHEFTFGWAITCHKAQGSQWPSVIVFDESRVFGEAARNHLYTAITRAEERVTVVL